MAKKRKGPVAGGQKQPPSSKKAKKRAGQDLYEAEDSDPDEVKHGNRYDKVENYQYEMPSDFEDEEIDEDLAFTEEDKKKYRAWFDEEEEASGSEGGEEEEGEEEEGSSDADMDMLDSDQEMEVPSGDGDGDDEEGSEGSAEEEGPEEQRQQVDDDEDDGFLDMLGGGGSDSEGDDEDAEQEESESAGDEEEEGAEQHRRMLESVMGQQAQPKAAAAERAKQAVVDEAYPESEYNLNPGAASTGTGEELTLADLMHGLGGDVRRKLPGTTRKLLEKMSGGEKKAVPAPLPRIIKERQERKAGYEATNKDVVKWQPIVKANREAPTLRFTSNRDEVPRINTTAAIVNQHTPESTMEEEVAALLQSAGAASSRAVAESEDKLAMKSLTIEEAHARRERLAKLRSLLFYDELKAKRLRNIKSKEFHRKQNKAAKHKALKMGDAIPLEGDEGDEAKQAERAENESAELDRAKERLTLKHRNTSRWARRALKRGATLHDPGTKAAITDQMQLGQALKRKIEGGRASDSEGSTEASTSGSEDEKDGSKRQQHKPSKARALAMEMIAGGGEQGGDGEGQNEPKKGLFGLPFMARAQERKRQIAQQEAEGFLRDLQEEEGDDLDLQGGFGTGVEEGREAAAGRFNFGGAAGHNRKARGGSDSEGMRSSDSESDEDGGLHEDAEAKAERLGKAGGGDGGVTKGAQQIQQQQRGRRRGQQGAAGAGGAGRGQQHSAEDEAALLAALEAAGVQTEGVAAAPTIDEQQQQQQQQSQHQHLHRHKHQQQQQQQQQQVEIQGHAASSLEQQHRTDTGRHASTSAASFMPARSFQGPRPGLAFRSGPQGLGYYPDSEHQGIRAPSQPGASGKGKQQQQQQKGVRIAGMPSTTPAAAQHAAAAGEGAGVGAKGGEDRAKTGGDRGRAEVDRDSSSDDEDERRKGGKAQQGMRPAPGSQEATQQELIRMAFAGDDVEAEFAADKAAEVGAELPHVEEPSALPGWGVWQEQQRNPKWMKVAKDKAQRERDKAADGRRDKGMQFVTISEKWDKKAQTYTTPSVPYPFDSKETYERSIRQPLGRQYNPDSAFRDLTRPAILKNTGVVIDPARYSKPLAKHTNEVASRATKPKVLTVAGGANQKPQKRG